MHGKTTIKKRLKFLESFILTTSILNNDALVTSNLVIYGVRDQRTGHNVEKTHKEKVADG